MKSSIRRQAALTAALFIGFYVLALGVAAALLFVAVFGWVSPDFPQNLWVSVACGLTGLAIAGAIVPRRLPFDPPGPQLEESEQPELFAVIREVADATGQEMPAEVYVAPDVNAAVTEVGGFLNRGGRRALILGLPLLQVLDESQLRSVLAHEFGHYYGGDTKLGPWLYRTHDTIARTLGALEQRESIFYRPFLWYGLFFLRRSGSMKRAQEFSADRLAARVAGKEASATSLRAVSGAAPAYDAYFGNELAPVLNAGFRPPMAEGFERFADAPDVRSAVGETVEEMAVEQGDAYDTHPPLGERLAAVEALSVPEPLAPAASDRRALELVRGLEELEQRVLAFLTDDERKIRELRPIGWDQVPGTVLLPGWREAVSDHAPLLERTTAEQLPEVIANLEDFSYELFSDQERPAEIEDRKAYGAFVLSAALGSALASAGWVLSAPPGHQVMLESDGHQVDPFEVIAQMVEGELGSQEWRERARAHGFAELGIDGSLRDRSA